MINLQTTLTEDLVTMLAKHTDAHLNLTKQVIQSNLYIIELKKLIEWRNLTVTTLIPPIVNLGD